MTSPSSIGTQSFPRININTRTNDVPEVPMGTALQRLGLRLTQILDGHEFAVLEHEFLNPALEEMQKLSIQSDRVPGEGMAALRRFAERCAQRDHQPDEHIGSAKCVACEAEDALRAIPADRVLGDGMEARTVVVPEYETMADLAWKHYFDPLQGPTDMFAAGRTAMYKAMCAELRTIPADRVMGEGMLSIHPDVLNSISDTLREIGDTAHNASTGPAVPDVLWEIREKAYEAYIVATDAEAEIMQAANAQDALSALRANQGGA